MAEPSPVRIEHLPRRDPLGTGTVVGTPEPRLSWQLPATEVELTDASGQVRRHRLDGTDQVLAKLRALFTDLDGTTSHRFCPFSLCLLPELHLCISNRIAILFL